MTTELPNAHFDASSDLPRWAVIVALVLAVLSVSLLLVELRRRERGGALLVATGILAVVALVFAVARPVRVIARESVVAARVVTLIDTSQSMRLPSDGRELRSEVATRAERALESGGAKVRFVSMGFADGKAFVLTSHRTDERARGRRSDLATALRELARSPEERPSAIVVISDGRLDEPADGASEKALRALAQVPIHTVATTRHAPADASIRRVETAGAAIAHVPLPMRVEVGCDGGLSCGDLVVTARELREDGPPALLASGTAHVKQGTGTVDLTLTLENAGLRIVEVAIAPPQGDTIEANDRRLLTFHVARERVRILHVAGRPTNDVRALRQWLKSDASLDVVAFFILRAMTNDAKASQSDLALIPFPVDELFDEHLRSFDAVVLQDFDAQPYGLARHLPRLASYVRSGGGLIMVGGQNAFVAGGYAGTPLAEVLPVTLNGAPGVTAADPTPFVPRWADDGRVAPLLGPLRAVVGDELPELPGANVLGDPKPGALVLWTHPSLTTPSGRPMPVLAIAEQGDGRTIALGVDGGWTLQFSALGARTSGRGHAALWDGLLGWLMRDPRYEPAQIESGPCTAGLPSTLRVRLPPLPAGTAEERVALAIRRLDAIEAPVHLEARRGSGVTTVDFDVPALAAGGFTARVQRSAGPATRVDFACETGGDEWADSRPDPERLRAVSRATGGTFRFADDDLSSIPLPKPAVVSAERRVTPIAPPWAFAFAAAMFLGAHWLVRRRSGLH